MSNQQSRPLLERVAQAIYAERFPYADRAAGLFDEHAVTAARAAIPIVLEAAHDLCDRFDDCSPDFIAGKIRDLIAKETVP